MKRNILLWVLLGSILVTLALFYIYQPRVQLAGDIAEYYGVTESVINHITPELTSHDQTNLEKILHPAYFENPIAYISGRDGERYSVHFIFYSLLVTPVRLILQLLHLNPLLSLSITNILIVGVVMAFIMHRFLPDWSQRLKLILLVFLSPLAFFIPWPGPDVLFVMLLLLSLFYFSEKKYLYAASIATIASWHSQPVMVIAGVFTLFYIFQFIQFHKKGDIRISFYPLLFVGIPAFLVTIPYFYNFYAFGVMTPWTILRDGWTLVNGFGLHNASLWKLYEQLFDLNMGLFWYAPLLLLGAILCMVFTDYKKKKHLLVLPFLFLLTCFFYQTNPAWHYGTAGFGPSRHSIFLLALGIFYIVTFHRYRKITTVLLCGIVITQVFILSTNGFFLPNFEDTLKQSPFAQAVLDTYPSLYNPSPEIFIDRTTQTDLEYPITAIYMKDGACKKAYVLKTETQKLIDMCGYIPLQYETVLENEYLRKTNIPRQAWTLEATFWPDTPSCEEGYTGEFQCMKTINDVFKYAGIEDETRIIPVVPYTGVWKLSRGSPIHMTIPPGYIVQHYSYDGVYVSYD